MSKAVIKIENLSKRYENDVLALDNISLEIYEGEIFSLLGPNGAGKTTLIKIITGQLSLTTGEVYVLGINHNDFLKSEARFKVSYVPQENVIWENLTVEENLEIMGAMYKLPKKTIKEKINYLLKEFDLEEARVRMASKLSGGMKRKLSIAMALINDPEILILDEPTAGLDPRTRAAMLATLEKLRELGKTILLTTHIVEEVERLADRVAIIHRGKIIKIDSPDILKQQSCGKEVLDLLFDELNDDVVSLVSKLVGENNIAIAGDKIIIRENNLTEILEKIKRNQALMDHVLTISIRKTNLEDAFLFLTGQTLEGE